MEADQDPFPGQPHLPELHARLRTELSRIDEQLRALLDAMDRMQGLLDAVVAISREVELPAVLHRIVTTAMDLVGARYGALTLQAFNASASLTALLLGAAVGERAQTEREIAQACRQLAEMATRIATSDRRPALLVHRNDQEAVSVESDTASE
ncbi:hypothetical protein ACIBQ5_05820 [Streptomyces massasporeus]|uniref:hypothetical protein n=1 Tax=Streptomyces massasporeus TaxID=67324 RepID=UPI0037A29EE3